MILKRTCINKYVSLSYKAWLLFSVQRHLRVRLPQARHFVRLASRRHVGRRPLSAAETTRRHHEVSHPRLVWRGRFRIGERSDSFQLANNQIDMCSENPKTYFVLPWILQSISYLRHYSNTIHWGLHSFWYILASESLSIIWSTLMSSVPEDRCRVLQLHHITSFQIHDKKSCPKITELLH